MPKPRPKPVLGNTQGLMTSALGGPKLVVDRRSVSCQRYYKEAGAESNSTLSPSAVPFGRGWKKKSDVT
jgi:hypothetical protein